MTDDQELDVSIANLSVQIFTVPSVAHHLIEKQDCLTKMVEFFTQIFEDEAKYGVVHQILSPISNSESTNFLNEYVFIMISFSTPV